MRPASQALALTLAAALALSLAACGRRGSLDAPPGAMPNAPDVTTREPRQKPPTLTPPDEKKSEPAGTTQPQPKPDRVLETPGAEKAPGP